MAATMLSRKAVASVRPAFAASRRSAVVVRASAEPENTSAPTEAPINAVSVQAPVAPAAVPVAATPAAPTLFEAMSFSNPVGPEVFNGRLAMLGLFAAVSAELATGESAITQFQSATPIVLATWALFTVASLVPLLRGADPTAAFGPFTRAAELANGRAAMLGAAGLLIVELTKGSALF